jgi:beta-lactamase regulating signal transducer with metallopeptidase domain
MTQFIDDCVVPWLALLCEWSIRWGIILALLAAWFAVRSPRRAAARHVVCWAALVAGLLIPLAPRWGGLPVPWLRVEAPAASEELIRTASVSQAQQAQAVRPALASRETDLSKTRSPAAAARAQSISLGGFQLAALAIASLWAFGVLVLLIRLAGGWVMLTRLSRGAVEVDRDSDLVFLVECKAAIGLSRSVRLAAHRAIGSPVAFGCLAARILVPAHWGNWPEAQRRACLLHELTHLKRRDDWSKLAQELISVFFFFHPLVRWLLARLDLERELLCDEAVVALGTEPAGYARILLEIARRPGRLLELPARVPGAILPFLERRTVAIRISRLLEDDMSNRLVRSSLWRSLILGVIAAIVSLAVTGVRIGAVEPQASGSSQRAPSQKIEGLILDPDGKPAADATVVAWIAGAEKANRSVLRTGESGSFTYSFPGGPGVIHFLAYKEGFSPSFRQQAIETLKAADRLVGTLGRSGRFTAIVVDGAGRPLREAKIRVEGVAHVSSRTDGTTTTIGSSYDWIRREMLAGSPLEGFLETTTGADGSFVFTTLEQECGLMLGAISTDGRGLRIRSKRNPTDSIRRGVEQEGFIFAATGEKPELVAIPEARILGRVVTSLPGVRVSGLKASFQTPHVYPVMTNVSPEHVLTDADGRFHFDGLNEGSVNVFVLGEGEQDWTYRAGKDVLLTPGKSSFVTIELIRGVVVEGTVVAKETNDPAQGLWVSVKGPLRPRTGAFTSMIRTDARGRYRFRLPPGETDFHVIGPVFGKIARLTVPIPEDRASFEMPVITVETDPTIRAKVVDADGQSVVGATILGIDKNDVLEPFLGEEFVTDGRGLFVLPSEVYKRAASGPQTRLRMRLPGGAEQTAIISFAPDNSVVIRLD